MSVSAPTQLRRAIAVFAVLLFTYATVLRKLGHDWWTDENYSHGLLIPFVIGYILGPTRSSSRRRWAHLWFGEALRFSVR